MSTGLCSFSRGSRGEYFFPSPASRDCPDSFAHDSFFHIQSTWLQSLLLLSHLLSLTWTFMPLLAGLLWFLPYAQQPSHVKILNSLICKVSHDFFHVFFSWPFSSLFFMTFSSLFLCKVTHLHMPRTDMWISVKGLYSVYHLWNLKTTLHTHPRTHCCPTELWTK